MSPLLQLRGVSTWFETPAGAVRAVDDVDLTLVAGRSLGLVGESGSGKSVLSRTIMRLLPPNAKVSGEVIFEGRNLLSLPRREARRLWGAEISMVFQDPMTSLNPVVRVGRQLTESMRLHLDITRREAQRQAQDLLAQLGIPEPGRRMRGYPHELSGGMRQRVSIAAALACSPQILIADEPTTALDVTIQRQILDLLGRLRADRGMAMMLITHDLGVVAGRTDDLAVMYGGRIVESGPTKVLFRTPRHPYTAALLASLPRIGARKHARLETIPGLPPTVIDPRGCCFTPRCQYATTECQQEEPMLGEPDESGQRFACFHPIDAVTSVTAGAGGEQ